MGKYEELEKFSRLTAVRRETFKEMVKILLAEQGNRYRRACRWVEDTLIKSKKFSLPGKKALLKSDVEYEVGLIDATESPCERPKKDKSIGTLVRKKDIHRHSV